MAPVALLWVLLIASPDPSKANPCPNGTLNTYLVDNSVLESDNPHGVSYRNTKNLEDKAKEDAAWFTMVEGIDEGDGWILVTIGIGFGPKYLPVTLGSSRVLVCNPTAEQITAAEQHKEAAESKSWWEVAVEIAIGVPIAMLICWCCLTGKCKGGHGGGYGSVDGGGGGDGGGA
eukprot:gnl/TRDRNA2_/TRDRNA2_161467_c0_seq1.p1 gnl/TRDRNA2_/TRDRNA2_161467_c0~~gnl/TRDRNA2_/TRDRNA2_161467_c0_seq1.p1  ORF type:complete len:174 (+),score=23.66 gnl/TRDRNA2_/TRDRNA2_161467_c0_seq1:48-569(+)